MNTQHIGWGACQYFDVPLFRHAAVSTKVSRCSEKYVRNFDKSKYWVVETAVRPGVSTTYYCRNSDTISVSIVLPIVREFATMLNILLSNLTSNIKYIWFVLKITIYSTVIKCHFFHRDELEKILLLESNKTSRVHRGGKEALYHRWNGIFIILY